MVQTLLECVRFATRRRWTMSYIHASLHSSWAGSARAQECRTPLALVWVAASI